MRFSCLCITLPMENKDKRLKVLFEFKHLSVDL